MKHKIKQSGGGDEAPSGEIFKYPVKRPLKFYGENWILTSMGGKKTQKQLQFDEQKNKM